MMMECVMTKQSASWTNMKTKYLIEVKILIPQEKSCKLYLQPTNAIYTNLL